MKDHRRAVIPVLVMLVAFSMFSQVLAYSETSYYDYTPDELYGVWNGAYHRAVETWYSPGVEKCVILFVFTGVSQSADDYWIDLNYDGVEPGYWPYTESLKMEYRWNGATTWTHLVYLDATAFDGYREIANATASTPYLRFSDCGRIIDRVSATWYFGS